MKRVCFTQIVAAPVMPGGGNTSAGFYAPVLYALDEDGRVWCWNEELDVWLLVASSGNKDLP